MKGCLFHEDSGDRGFVGLRVAGDQALSPVAAALRRPLRNKALLVPDTGPCVTSFLKANLPPDDDLRVINLIADIFGEEELFLDRTTGDGEEETDCPISEAQRTEEARSYLRDALLDYQPDVVLFPLSIYYIALHARQMLTRVRRSCREVTIVTGGVYATLHPQEILADGAADCVVRGEGEWTLTETLDALKRGGDALAGVAGLSWRRDGEIHHNPDRERERVIDRFLHIYTVSEEFRIGLRHRLLKRLNPVDYIPGAGILTSPPGRVHLLPDPAVWKRITRASTRPTTCGR